MTTARIRRDPRDQAASRRRGVARDIANTAEVVVVDDPACCVLAVVDAQGGRLSQGDREMLGAARLLADELSGALAVLACLPPGMAERLRPEAVGADRFLQVVAPGFAEAWAETRLPAVLQAAEVCAARHLLFPETPIGGELGRRVAARLGDRPAAGLRRVSAREAVCAADAGRADLFRPLARVLIPAPGAFAPVSGPEREARRIELPPYQPIPPPRCRTLSPDPADVPLTEAELIISGGGGLDDWDAFHAAARLLGAAEAGSRVVCDAGLLPRGRQVGSSGVLVSPRCYMAFGIAGAPQHLQGVEAAQRVVAVNTDARAEMLRRADLAIVADVQAVLPALVERARARLSPEITTADGR